jgi:hypothetical protein
VDLHHLLLAGLPAHSGSRLNQRISVRPKCSPPSAPADALGRLEALWPQPG